MDPVNPWLDPSEVRHLAEQLLRPVPPSRLAAADPGFGSSFVGFMATDDDDAHAGQTQAPSSAPPVSQPAPEPPPVAPLDARFLERILIFRDWLAENFQATDIFILGHNGIALFGESGREHLHLLARDFASASRGTGDIQLMIGPAAILEIIPCQTQQGHIVLGAVVPDNLPDNHVAAITEVLIQTASPA